ncbi:MAG: ribonuclease T [Pseudomonadota bacterium]
MKDRKQLLALLGGLLILSGVIGLFEQGWRGETGSSAVSSAKAGAFDFWVLALSWSPSYCANNKGDTEQCGADAPGGMVVHGLWPQLERGYPEFCDMGPERIPRRIATEVDDLIPSDDAVFHQWRKHGRCSGQSAQGYFDTLRTAADRVAVPELFSKARKTGLTLPAAEIEEAFIQANPGLARSMLAISCHAGQIRDVRVCLNRDMTYRACSEVDQRGCKRVLDIPAFNRS